MNYKGFYIETTSAGNTDTDHTDDVCCTVYKEGQSEPQKRVEIGHFDITTNEIGDYGTLEAAIIGHMQRDYPDNDLEHEERYHKIQELQESLQAEQKTLLIDLLKRNGGRVTSHPVPDEDGSVEYPVTMAFYGNYDNPNISITDVYLDGNGDLYVDGIDESTGIVEHKYQVYPEQCAWVLNFLALALGFNGTGTKNKSIR